MASNHPVAQQLLVVSPGELLLVLSCFGLPESGQLHVESLYPLVDLFLHLLQLFSALDFFSFY